jgi:hypothetical protein
LFPIDFVARGVLVVRFVGLLFSESAFRFVARFLTSFSGFFDTFVTDGLRFNPRSIKF